MIFCGTVIVLLFAVCLQYFTYLHKTVLDFNTQIKLIFVIQRCSRRVCYFKFYLHYKQPKKITKIEFTTTLMV